MPRGNPDRLRVSSAESYAKYDISGLDDLTPDEFESIHGGYDRMWANLDPDVVVPLDVMRELEREGCLANFILIYIRPRERGRPSQTPSDLAKR